MTGKFPDEVAYFSRIRQNLNETLVRCNQTVARYDQDYTAFKQYMVNSRSEIDPHEMFQNEQLLRQTDHTGIRAVNLRNKIEKIIDSPYFARIDFKPKGNLAASPYYIGRFSFDYHNELLILDWRAPAAGMFYDFETGDAAYTAPAGRVEGEITRKRQFGIKKGKLEYVLESGLTIRDDVLQRELSGTSDEKMKTVIATIQAEQNRIIRNEEAETLIIQGVAGSGKTSVALHRLAYLLYRRRQGLCADNLILLSPNKVFADFISGVLPELGEEPVATLGFADIAARALKGVIRFEREPDVSASPGKAQVDRLVYKSTAAFLRMLDAYLAELDEQIFCPADFRFGQFRVSADWIISRFRQARGQAVLERLKTVADDMREELESNHWFGDTPPKKSAILTWLKNGLTLKSTLAVYRDFFRKNRIQDKFVCRNNTLEWPDVFPFLYVHAAFHGLPADTLIRHAVIDEMQDYTPVQFAVINRLYPCQKTILGDFGQCANPYHTHTLNDLAGLYDGAELVTLNKSYRSSYEIISFARALGGTKIEAVERHGDPPAVHACKNAAEELQYIRAALSAFGHSGKTLGILAKTDRTAEELYRALSPDFPMRLIGRDSSKFETGVSVVSVPLSKGLEFDEVIVPSVNRTTYPDAHDRSLLYIACTRAMHRLTVLYHGEKAAWLPDADLTQNPPA